MHLAIKKSKLSTTISKSSQHTLHTCLSIICHLIWGFHPVFSRYLQVEAGVNGLVMLAATQWASMPFVLYFMYFIDTKSNQNNYEQVQNDSGNQKKLWGKKVLCIFGFGLLMLLRESSSVISCNYTAAYNIQMISQLGPFVMALLSRVFLSEHIPMTLWCSLLFSTIGIQLVVISQSNLLNNNNNDNNGSSEVSGGLTKSDIIGMFMQFVSTLFSSFARLIVQISSDVVTRGGLIFIQNVSIGVSLTIFTCLFYLSEWKVWTTISAIDWVGFWLFICSVWIVGDLLQMACIRWLGSAEHATYQPLRIISTLITSYLTLNETIDSFIGWIGLFILMFSISFFLIDRARRQKIIVSPINQTDK